MEDCPDDTRDESHNESTVVDISNVKLEFLKVTGNKAKIVIVMSDVSFVTLQR